MGKQSRRKAELRASAAERRQARELVAEFEAGDRPRLNPEVTARILRWTSLAGMSHRRVAVQGESDGIEAPRWAIL